MFSQSMRDVFTRHGGVALETPTFELKEILTGSKAHLYLRTLSLTLN
jgi:histidyl-tRNA synthetase